MFRRMLFFLRPYCKTLAGVALLNLCAVCLKTMQPMLGKWLIDEVLISRKYAFLPALGACVAFMCVAYGLSMLTRYVYLRTSLQIMAEMRAAFYRHLLRLPSGILSKRRVGDLVSRVTEDLGEMQRLYTDGLLQLVSMALDFLLNLGLLLLLDWQTTVFCFLLFPVLIGGTQKFRHLLFARNLALREQAAATQSFLYETLSAIRFVRSAALHGWLENRYKGDLEKLNKQTVQAAFASACAQGVPQAVLIISTIVGLWLLGEKVLAGSFSIGSLLAFAAYQASLYASVHGFAQLYVRFQKGKAAVRRVSEFFGLPEELDGTRDLPPVWSQIRFENVSFRHAEGGWIFHKLNVAFSKGEKIGIIGESGVGKSTLADLLARVHQPVAGRITIDGVEIQQIRRDIWSQKVCLVAHDHPVWHGSIEDVLRLGGNEVDGRQMRSALEQVGLWNDIAKLPDGLQTQVGDQGSLLSAGQRQRLLLARALLQDPDILILDEATCHLDMEAEREFFELIRHRFHQKTVIVITHRLPNILWVDRLLELTESGIQCRESDFGGELDGTFVRVHG